MVSGRLARARKSGPGGPEVVNERFDKEFNREIHDVHSYVVRYENDAVAVAEGPAPSPCITLSPTGFPFKITAFITPLILEMYYL